MRYRPLGGSGLMVSVVGLGCNNLGRDQTRTKDLGGSRDVVEAALDAGITLFDTADSYGNPRGASEELLGQCVAGRRDEVVLATKFGADLGGAIGPDWGARGSRRYVRRAVEASLRRLRTEWIDLYQYHTPDGITPVEETLAALDEMVTAGLVRYVGSSNLAAWQVVEAEYTARSAGTVRFARWPTGCSPGSTPARPSRRSAPGSATRSGGCTPPRTGTASRRCAGSPLSAASACSRWPSAGWPRSRRSAQ